MRKKLLITSNMLKNKKNRLLNPNAQMREQKKTNSKRSQRFLANHKQHQKNETNHAKIINYIIELKALGEPIAHTHTHTHSFTQHTIKKFASKALLSRRRIDVVKSYFALARTS